MVWQIYIDIYANRRDFCVIRHITHSSARTVDFCETERESHKLTLNINKKQKIEKYHTHFLKKNC